MTPADKMRNRDSVEELKDQYREFKAQRAAEAKKAEAES
jgi:hypothetical protein